MPELNLNDPFGFHKSIESGEFKLEGVGKLYGQDDLINIEGSEFRFELLINLKNSIRGEITLIPINTTGMLSSNDEKKQFPQDRGDFFISSLKLIGKSGSFSVSADDILPLKRNYNLDTRVGFKIKTIHARFYQLRIGLKDFKYERCLMWIPNLSFGGCASTKYDDGSIKRDSDILSLPSLLGGVEIRFNMLKNSKAILKDLKKTHSSAITTLCDLRFNESKSFDEIQSFVDDFFHLVSFVTGQRIWPIVYWLRGEEDTLVVDLRGVYNYESVATWCNYSQMCNFGKPLQEIADWFFYQDGDTQKTFKSVIGHYVAANGSDMFAKIILLSVLYGMYISSDDWLDSESRNYPLARCSRKKLRKMLEKFLNVETKLSEDKVKEWVNIKMSDFIRSTFRDQISALFKQHGLLCGEHELDVFVKTRNAVVHPDLNDERVDLLDPEVVKSIMYMFRQFEVLTLKRMGYTGKFQDRLNIPRNVPFKKILEEQKI